jgi:hypothetical protein
MQQNSHVMREQNVELCTLVESRVVLAICWLRWVAQDAYQCEV